MATVKNDAKKTAVKNKKAEQKLAATAMKERENAAQKAIANQRLETARNAVSNLNRAITVNTGGGVGLTPKTMTRSVAPTANEKLLALAAAKTDRERAERKALAARNNMNIMDSIGKAVASSNYNRTMDSAYQRNADRASGMKYKLDQITEQQNRNDALQRILDNTDREGRDIRRQLNSLADTQLNSGRNANTSLKFERAMQNGGLNPQDTAKAEAFRRERNALEMQRSIDDIRNLSERNPLAGAAVSTFGNIGSAAITPAATVANKLRGERDIDINAPIYRLARQAQAAREGTQQGVKNAFGISDYDENGNRTIASQVADFGTGTALSMIDTIVRSAFMGPFAGGLEAGLSAGAQGFIDAKEKGLDDWHAIATGTAQGIAEELFETVSLEGLEALKNKRVDGLKNLILNMGKQSVTEGSEEFFTDWANALTDYAINGGDSEWRQSYDRYIAMGMSEREAIARVAQDTLEQSLLSFLGGAVSGALLGGGTQLAEGNFNRQVGQALMNEGQTYTPEMLLETAAGIETNPDAFFDERGILNQEALDEAVDTQAYLRELADRTVGREITPAEMGAAYNAQERLVENAVDNGAEIEELEENENRSVEELNEELGSPFAVYDAQKEQGYYLDEETAQRVAEEDRKALRLFEENEDVRLPENVRENMIDAYTRGDMHQYMQAYKRAYVGGYNDVDIDTVMRSPMVNIYLSREQLMQAYKDGAATANIDKKVTFKAGPARKGGLTSEEMSSALRAGAADANNLFPAKASAEMKRIAKNIKAKGRQGSVKFDGVDYNSLTTQQKMRVDFSEALLTKGLGMDVIFVQSGLEDGKYQGANGAYQTINGRPTITLDVNAGMNYESDWTGQMTDIKTLLPTVSHELTHFLEKANKDAYQQIAQSVVGALQKSGKYSKGLSFNEILNEERTRLDSVEQRSHTNDDALHEIVARACEDMLSGNKQALQAFENLDANTKKTISDHIKEIFDNIRDFFEQMLKEYRSGSAEARAIRSNMEEFEKIRDMWNEALNANYDIVHASEISESVDASLTGSEQAFSIRQIAQASDYDLLVNSEGVPYSIVDPSTGEVVNEVTEDHMRKTPIGVLVDAALQKGTITQKAADAQIKMFTDLMNLIVKYDNLPMVWEIAGSYTFSAVKTNADKQYSDTVDYGTICAKTQALIEVLSKTMVEKGRGLTREEVLKAYNETAKTGLSVPCPVCYVFSRWMGVPSLLENMRKCQIRFNDITEEQVQKYIKGIQDKYVDKGLANHPDKKKRKSASKQINEAKVSVQNQMERLERRLQDAMTKRDTAKQAEITKEADALQKELNALESYNWVTQVRCKETKKNSGVFVLDPKYKPVPNEILLDFTKSGEFARDYAKAWKYRTTRGAGMGKAIQPYSGHTIGDLIRGGKNGRYVDEKNPMLNHDKAATVRALGYAIERARKQNTIGGQRFQSTSDFRAEWGIDYLMTFLECQCVGSQVQLYTKVIEAVDLFASAGAEVNLSIMPKNDGYITLHDGSKKLVFSNVTGVDFDAAYEKVKQYDNVQMILVGINDDHIRLAMADDRIGFIIPWHPSGNSKETLASLMESVGEKLLNATSYEDYQSDKVIDEDDKVTKARRAFRKQIIQGKLWADYKSKKPAELTASQQAMLDENPYFNDLYERFYLDKSSQEYGLKLNGDQSSGIFPYEYWDKSLTVKDADENGRRFCEYCEYLGLTPRFSQFANDPGYWKLLIDRSMYNNDGTYHTPKAIDVTNVEVSKMPMAVNSNNYKDQGKIAQATMDTLMALDGAQNDLQAVDDISTGEITEEDEASADYGEVEYSHRVTATEKLPGAEEKARKKAEREAEKARRKAEREAKKSRNKAQYSVRDIETAANDPSNDKVIRQGSDKDIQYSTRVTDKNINDKLKVSMGTFFSGTGTVDFALRNIVRHEFAVEYDAKIAAVYRANNGDNIYVDDVRNVDINPHKGKVEYFHASPVCKSYSNANNDQGEKPLDIETARATADAIDTLQPKVVTVENVAKYRNSEAIKLIEGALERNGYEFDKGVYRASDFGGATIRERMFLRAVKDGVLPEIDTSEYEPMTWYEAVEDLIPSLPKAEFSDYMEERLDVSGIDIDNLEAPIFILGGEKSGKLTWAAADKPAPTILTKSTEAKIVMPDGRVLRATPRVMARIQGLPDSFDLKDSKGGMTNAYKVVGNGVPTQLTQGIVGPLLEQNLIKRKSESLGIQYSSRNVDSKNPAVFEGKPFWSGSVSMVDGVIEEVHSYEEAEMWEFHHSMYFSSPQLEKMDSGENAFFCITGADITVEDISGFRDEIPDDIIRAIRKQIKPNDGQNSQRGVDLDQRLDALVQKYGALPNGEKAVKDISVPEQTSDGKRVRRYARTVLESGITSDMMDEEIKEKILKEGLSYEPVTDESAAEYAASVLRIGGTAKAQKEWDRARRSDTFNKDAMAVGQELLREYAKQGDVENVVKMVTELAAEGTRMGQNIQAMRMLKKYATQSPAIGLGYIQRTVDIMNREAKAKMGKRYKEMKIDQRLADEYVNATTKDEIDAALGKIYKNLGSQVQKTTGEEITDRLRAWRYSAMLGNPRTHVRNLVGNALFVPAVTIKNAIGSALESAAKTDTRAKSLTVSKAAKQFAAQDAIEMRDVLQGNADKSIRQLIMDERKTFTAPALNTFKKLNGDALEYEDWIFLRYHYQNALAQYITANKLDTDNLDGKDLAKARQYAVKEAQKATYRDANKLSTWLNQSKEAGPIRFIMEGMLPFKKTPTNILRRGIEYSPAMLVLSIKRGIVDLNQGKITTNEWIDGLASGLTGTAIFGLGMFLASTGAILGGYKDDDDKDKRKLKGEQEYAVKIGNHTYTIDWAAPSALPLFVGVETMSALRSDGNLNFDDIAKSAAKIVDPMINMSMLSGLNDTLDAIAYSDSKLSAIGGEALFSLLGQFVPTILGQAARTIDTTQRINYQDVNKGMPKNMLYFIEKMQNKIPYMTFSNDPYLDAFGRENTTESRFIAALQNFVFPWYTSKLDDDRVVNTVTELQNNTEERVIPKKMPKYLGQGEERIDLTSAQYTQFQRTAGQLSYNILDSMIADSRYNKLTADEQAAAIKMAYDYAKACGRIEIQPEYESKIDGDTKKIYNAVDEGKQAYDTILTLLRGDKVTENITATEDKTKKQNTIDAIINSDLTEKEKETVFETEYDSAKLDAWKTAGGRTNDFMIYSLSMGNIKGDKKKERTIQYIESLKLNEEQSKILYDVAGYEPEKFSAATIDAKIPEDTDKYLFVSQSKEWTPEQKVEWFKSDSQRTDGKKYKAWKNAGGVDYDYIKYRGDISRYDGLPKKEKKSKVTEYINSTGLNAEKKRVLWTFAGYKESTCPW